MTDSLLGTTPVLGAPAAVPVNAPIVPPAPPPGAPAPVGTKMATDTDLPGHVAAAQTATEEAAPGTKVIAPMADAQPAGTLVVAKVAPVSGMPTGNAAVVAVISWDKSKQFLLSLGVFLEAMGEIAVNAALPILSSLFESGTTLDWPHIKAALWRPVIQAVISGTLGYLRLRDNRTIGKPDAV